MRNVFMTSHNIVPLYFYQISKIYLFLHPVKCMDFYSKQDLLSQQAENNSYIIIIISDIFIN